MLDQDITGSQTIEQALGIASRTAILRRIANGEATQEDLDCADWGLGERVQKALGKVGLSPMSLQRNIRTLSGGERTRIGIARLQLESSDLLLLDEPTNNLDADGRELVGAFVRDWRGGALIASHDRALLEAMDRIVELRPVGARVFGGGWSAFEEARNAERERAAEENSRAAIALRAAKRSAQERQEAKARRDRSGRIGARRRSDSKIVINARMERAQGSVGRVRSVNQRMVLKAEERQENARASVDTISSLNLELPKSRLANSKSALALDAVEANFGDRRLGPWTFRIDGSERVAIRGANGAGKSTLLNIVAGMLKPSSGEIRRSCGRIAMLDQHAAALISEKSIVDNICAAHPELDDEETYAQCARFGFRNDGARATVGSLSGGEKLRASLACAFGGKRPPWLLILDEPTNHLDNDTVELLEQALQDYDGALLVVSHDVAFLQKIGTRRFIDI